VSIEIVSSGATDEVGLQLLKQAAEQCMANGGEWYSPNQVLGILRHYVSPPALLADAAFIGMCMPELILKLFAMAEGSRQ
jgi:hypothetical protein